MALATRPKPTTSHRKRQAGHHRHSKSYLGTYWPYLPMFAIVVGGAVVNKLWASGSLPGVTTVSPPLAAAEPLTRIQMIAGSQANAVLAVVIIVSGLAAGIFVVHHWRRLHRLLNKGEALAYQYAWLDIIAVLIVTVGVVLTRPGGPVR